MTYDDMPAGLEIDRLVAEQVMGWAILYRIGVHYEATGKVRWAEPGEDEQEMRRILEARSAQGHTVRLIREPIARTPKGEAFHPSTDIADAWQVVERVRRLRALDPPSESEDDIVDDDETGESNWVWPWVEVQAFVTDDPPDVCRCTIYHGQSERDLLAEAEAETVPLAICRAALKLVSLS